MHLLLLALLLLPLPALAGELHLTLTGCPAGANLRLALHDTPALFASDNSGERGVRRLTTVSTGTTSLSLASLPPGRYALSSYCDLNGDGRLGTNFVGMPTEPYGFSRNARSRFGRPDFADAAFSVGDEPMRMAIDLK